MKQILIVARLISAAGLFADSVNDFVKQGPKTFVDSIKHPSSAAE